MDFTVEHGCTQLIKTCSMENIFYILTDLHKKC